MTTTNQIAPKLVDIETTLVNTVIDQFAEATEACDRALSNGLAADQISREADRLSDEAQAAQNKAEEARAEAHSAEIDATVHLSRLIVSAIKNATPSEKSAHYLGEVFRRITQASKIACADDPTGDRWIEQVAGLIESFDFNPNA